MDHNVFFAFALHGAGHFGVDESNQDPYKSGAFLDAWNLEPWKPGTQNPGNLELWNLGTLEICNLAILEACSCGILEPCKHLGALSDNIATLETWNLLSGCKLR